MNKSNKVDKGKQNNIHKTITSHQQTKTIPSKVSHSEHEHLRNSSIHRFPQIIDHPNMCLALF